MAFTIIARRYRVFSLLMILALGLALPFSAPAGAASSVSPAQGSVGTRFTFTADGFEPGEQLNFWLTAPDDGVIPRFPWIDADNNGAAVWTWDVPEGASNGTWRMTARGIKTDTRVVIAFEVVGSAPTPPARSVNPPSGAPGTTFTFSASGFDPKERVGTWLNQPDGRDIELRPPDNNTFWVADEGGQLTWTWSSPGDVAGGSWRALARGFSSNRQISMSFEVAGPPAAAPSRSVSPPSGGPGTTFTFSAGGFNGGEQLGTWLNRPDGSRIDATPWLFAEGNGQVTWTWTAPADAPGGRWQAVTRGFDSRVEVTIDFTVSGSNPLPSEPIVVGSVTPPSGQPGTTFTFSAAGFAPGEAIDFWPIDPQSVPDPNFVQTSADGDGRANWTWTPTDRAAPGEWTMAARGQSTRRTVQIKFVVLAASPSSVPDTGVEPGSGGPGTTFSFTARGFNQIEWVELWLTTPDGRVIPGPLPPTDDPIHNQPNRRDTRANGQGVAQWQWTAPDDVQAGNWTMTAKGRDSDVMRVIPFTIVRDAPPAPKFTVTPATGGPGTTFNFTASGYEDGEKVGYWLTAPDKSVVRVDIEAVAGSDGQIAWSWTAPADAQRGVWTMVTRSSQADRVNNDVQYVIPFTIQ